MGPFRIIAASVVLSFWAAALVAQSQTADRPAVIKSALEAVVTLRAYDADGKAVGLGSGFFLPDGRIATNRHVVAGAVVVEAKTSSGSLVGSFSYAEVMSVSADLAILPRVGDPPRNTKLETGDIGVGTHVYVIGAPLGLQGTVSDGIVSAVRELDGQTLLQMTAPISEGSSGGPVINDNGAVVGVSVGAIQGGQNLNFAVPVRELRALMASPAGRVSFPPAERSSKTAPDSSLALSSVPDMLSAIPSLPISVADDSEFRVEFKGCFGAASARDVLVCVCDFRLRTGEKRRRTLGVWRASIASLGGGSVLADAATDLTTTYPFSGGTRGVTVFADPGGAIRVFFRFLTTYSLDARPVMEVGLGAVNARRVERAHLFPPTPIIQIDPTKNDRIRVFFGVR